jgi:Protein of unknown function (DUF3551)
MSIQQEVSMRSMVLGLVAVLATATVVVAADSGRPHRQRVAGPPEWCNQGNEVTGGMMECSYHTLQQCLISVRGVGGTCIPNPYYEWARYYRGRPYGY